MKNYYIINKKIIEYETELDSQFYNYPKLTDSQATFYEQNPNANLDEVLEEQLYLNTLEGKKRIKKYDWNSKLQAGYLSTALNLTMSLTNSIIDNEDVFLKAQKLEFVLKNNVIPQLESAGLDETSINNYQIDIRDKQGVKHSKSISICLAYIAEMTKIGLKINEVNGALFDASTEEDLNAINIDFDWNTVI